MAVTLVPRLIAVCVVSHWAAAHSSAVDQPNWLYGPPRPLCTEHEMEVPEPWQDPDKVDA